MGGEMAPDTSTLYISANAEFFIVLVVMFIAAVALLAWVKRLPPRPGPAFEPLPEDSGGIEINRDQLEALRQSGKSSHGKEPV